MKNKFLLVIACVAVLSMAGCGDTSTDTGTSKSTDSTSGTVDTSSAVEETQEVSEPEVYGIGETWTVDGQWELTINSVEETFERNEYADKEPAAVYIVDYSYTNLGYESDIMDGLYISLDMESIVDSEGIMGYSYPGDISYYPREAPVGATCNAQACIGVDNAGDFALYVSKYDTDYENQYSAIFNVTVE